MAFEVGAIVSKLTLNTQKWSQSVSTVKSDQKAMGDGAKTAGEKFRKMGAAMTIAGAAITTALGLMTKKFVDTGDWIDKMSKRTGFSAESLSELAYAADLSGASLSDVERSVKRMSGSILDAHSGLESYARAFRVMGVSVDDLMKMNPEQQFLAISEAIAKIEDPTIRAALAQDVFGRAGTALLPMMSEGAEGLQKMRQEARDLGVIFTTETAASAAKLKDSQTALKESVKGLSMAFIEHLVPCLTDLVQKITGIITKIKDWVREHPELAAQITKVVAVAAPLATIMGTVMLLLPKLAAGFATVKGAVIGMISPVGLLTAAVAALAIGWMKVKEAQDKANKAAKTAAEQSDELARKVKAATDAAGLSEREFWKLHDAYQGNIAAMAMAIKQGKEGKALQESLAKVSKEHKEEIDKQKTAVTDLTGQFKGYLDELTKVEKKQKTWIDYLHDRGIITAKETKDKIAELEKELKILNDAYDRGDISMQNYIQGTNAVKEEIEKLSTVMTTTTVPAARNMSLVYKQAVGEMETKTGDFTVKLKTKAVEVINIGKEMSETFAGSFKTNLEGMLLGTRSWKDAILGIFGDLKAKFASIIADMVTNWVMGFAQKLITSTLTSTTSVASQLTSTASNLIKQVGSWSPGGIVGSVISGAISGLFGSLFGKKAAGFDKHDSGNLRELRDIARNHRDIMAIDYKDEVHTSQNLARDMIARIDQVASYQNVSNSILKNIERYAKEVAKIIGKITGAQGGAVFTGTELAVMHGTPQNPEVAMPASTMNAGGGIFNKTVAINIYVNNQLDPYSAQEITRRQIVPEMLRAIDVDPRNKTELRRIMGIER